jgi:3-deoxy-D-manno-oct-2-ulosonic acid (Kdo) hydroxylase
MDATLSLPVSDWRAPPSREIQERALPALEAGTVLVFPRLMFPLLPGEQGFLTESALSGTRKNISYDPATGKLGGTQLPAPQLADLTALLARFGNDAVTLIRNLLPRYAPYLQQARASFRPAEILGRTYAPRHDDRRLHTDAFPTRPTQGGRILRLFVNIDPTGTPREWQVSGAFEQVAARFLPQLDRTPLGQPIIANLAGRAMAGLNLTRGRRTPYDFLMLGLHDRAKLDDEYQASAPRTAVTFAPGTAWLCYTDSVSHAALAGRNTLEQTFHLPVSAMAQPELSPLRVLERLSGHALT